MESVQEACQQMSGIKRVVSGWAMKKGLQGNMNKQSKYVCERHSILLTTMEHVYIYTMVTYNNTRH